MTVRTSQLKELFHLSRAVRLVWQSGPVLMLVSAVLAVFQALLPLAGLYLTKVIIDGVSVSTAAADGGIQFGQILLYIALAGGVVLLGSLCSALSGYVKQAQSEAVSDHILDVLHAKSIAMDLQYYENSDFYELLHRTQREAPFRPARIVNGLLGLGQNAFSLLAIAGLLFSFHWAIPIVLLLGTLPGVAVRLFQADRMYEWQVRRTGLERQGGYLHYLLLDESHAKELRLFNLGPLFVKRFHELRTQLRKEKLQIFRKQSLGELITSAGGVLTVFASYAYIAHRTVHGMLSIGDLVMYMGAFQRGQSFLQSLLGTAVGLYEDGLFIANFYEFLDLKSTVPEPANSKPMPRPMRKGIRFDDVSFTYPGSTAKVLDGIHLEIRPGEVIGLVGENGSGKTTLIKLLCRFYDPTEGCISIDGIDFREMDTVALRSQISVVFQDYRRYYTTVRENIWFGDILLPPEDTLIRTAAEYSGVDKIVSGFEQRYETVLGKWLENGEELSIGQLQKLAVARAFFRDAQIMVLDEPTSAMDAKAEFELFERFRKMAWGRTIILISHRLSTLRKADKIHVMQHGKIIESGTHGDLVGKGGTYAELFETQAQAYR